MAQRYYQIEQRHLYGSALVQHWAYRWRLEADLFDVSYPTTPPIDKTLNFQNQFRQWRKTE